MITELADFNENILLSYLLDSCTIPWVTYAMGTTSRTIHQKKVVIWRTTACEWTEQRPQSLRQAATDMRLVNKHNRYGEHDSFWLVFNRFLFRDLSAYHFSSHLCFFQESLREGNSPQVECDKVRGDSQKNPSSHLKRASSLSDLPTPLNHLSILQHFSP